MEGGFDAPVSGGGGGNLPIPPVIDDPASPCGRAQALSSDAVFGAKVNELFTKTVNYRVGDMEYGCIKTAAEEYIYPTRKVDALSYSPSALAGKKITEEYHNHPVGSCIPSWGDLRTMAKRYDNGQMDVENFSFGVISSMGCFTLVVTSEEAFKVFVQKVMNEDLHDGFQKMLDVKNTRGVDSAVAKFIDFLKQEKSGLDVLFNDPIYDFNADSFKLGNWKAKNSNGDMKIEDYNCNK